MTLSLNLPAEIEARLREKAKRSGEPVDVYALKVLSNAVTAPSVDEVLADFRRQVAESGMSDEQLDEFYEGLRNEVWAERKGQGG